MCVIPSHQVTEFVSAARGNSYISKEARLTGLGTGWKLLLLTGQPWASGLISLGFLLLI